MAKGAQGADVDLSALYADLKRFGDAQNYDKALKTANAILKVSHEETEALQFKVVCLIQLNDFQNALEAIDKHGSTERALVFEKAYCQYRLYENEAALKTLNSTQKLDLRCRELKAQLLYRMEDYDGSLKLFKDVLKNSQDDYDDERQTNYSAVLASISMSADPEGSASELEAVEFDEEEMSYEHCYNSACFLIGQGDYKAASERLRKAETLCQLTLEEEEMTEEERDDELSIIRVQIAYCSQMLGDTNEALRIYNASLKTKPSDSSVAAVAANNTVCINQDQNVFDSKKKMKLALAPELDRKLPKRHLETIDVNHCLLMFYANQLDACRNQCRSLKEQYPNNEVSALVESCLLDKAKQTAKAVQLLQELVQGSTNPSLSLQLNLAQLHLCQGDVTQACHVLRALGGDTYRPAIVSLLVSLYMSQEDSSSVSEFFTDVVSWYEKNEPQSDLYKKMLKASAELHMKQKNPKMAAGLLEKLRRLSSVDDDDRSVLSMLFAAYSLFDPSKAKQNLYRISSELPSVESLAEQIDVIALEESPSIMGNKYKAKPKDDKSATTGAGEGSEQQELKKKTKRKKRKMRLPKDYNADVDPDPERWLPKQERSTWKGRRRNKKKNDVGKGSQGAAGGPELDITKMESVGNASNPTHHLSTGTKGYSASKQQQKKKKRSKK